MRPEPDLAGPGLGGRAGPATQLRPNRETGTQAVEAIGPGRPLSSSACSCWGGVAGGLPRLSEEETEAQGQRPDGARVLSS